MDAHLQWKTKPNWSAHRARRCKNSACPTQKSTWERERWEKWTRAAAGDGRDNVGISWEMRPLYVNGATKDHRVLSARKDPKEPRRVDASRACAGSRLNLRRVVHGQITDLELSFVVIEDWTRPVLVLDAHEDLVNAGCIKSSTGWQGDTQLDLVVRVVEAA